MKTITYNDTEFSIQKTTGGWSVTRKTPDGTVTDVAVNLFGNLTDNDAETRALALVRTVFPAGIKLVGPDVAHPNRVGDLKIVGPDVSHPNFINWDSDSTSFPRQA